MPVERATRETIAPRTASSWRKRRRRLAERTPVVAIGDGAAAHKVGAASPKDDGAGNSATVLGSGPRAQAVRRAMLLNPPPLIAAVFPWNRGSDGMAASFDEEHHVVEHKGGDGDKHEEAEGTAAESDGVNSGSNGAWRRTEGQHGGDSLYWKMEDNVCVTRGSFRAVVVAAIANNIQSFFVGGHGFGVLKSKQKLAERNWG
ncbi:hypothetical protein PIB30_033381 [Stylosanthes scabra]|uniref:Uncharacterized protein n=1 Tax=Stylosanthes scabra TaxID=79078 RepID=A0ABU6ZCL3_9FABA|nr:hypothetical protein [Stylosanthes scabra]